MKIEHGILRRLTTYVAFKEANKPILKRVGLYTLSDMFAMIGSPDLFLAVASILSPSIICYRGIFFIEERFSEENYLMWEAELGNWQDAQKTVNHVHLYSILPEDSVDDYVGLVILKTVKMFWSEMLKEYNVVVEIFGDSVGDMYITFYQGAVQDY